MDRVNEMIKISYSGKTLLVTRPKDYSELQRLFCKKFNIGTLKSKRFHYKDEGECIDIENDEDLQNAYDYCEGSFRIYLSPIKEQNNKNKTINMNHLHDYVDFLEDALPYLSEEVMEIVDKEQIPCKECFFNKKSEASFDLSDYSCDVCKDKRSVEMTKSWKLILLLIDYKIKQYLLDPLNFFQNENGDETREKKEIRNTVLDRLPNGASYLDDSKTNSRLMGNLQRREFYPQQDSFFQQSMSLSYNATVDGNNTHSRSYIHQKKSTEDAKDNRRKSLLLLNQPLPNQKFYTTCYLKFTVHDSKVEIVGNTVEIKFMIDNHSDMDWPKELNIKGMADDPVTKDVKHCIAKTVKKNCLCKISFKFELPQNTDRSQGVFSFKFDLVEDEKGMIYTSDKFVIENKTENKKKRGFFNFCNYIK